jgi:hypothetical protein
MALRPPGRSTLDSGRLAAEFLPIGVRTNHVDLAEYDERVRHAYAARTYQELDELLTDLPDPLANGPGNRVGGGRGGRRGGIVASLGEQHPPPPAVRAWDGDPFAEDPAGRRERLAPPGRDELANPVRVQVDQQRPVRRSSDAKNRPSSRTQGSPIIVDRVTAGSA